MKYGRLILVSTDLLHVITCTYTKRHKSMKINEKN